MCKSRQRLGDNPRDHDGKFSGFDDDKADVSGIRADVDAYTPPASPFHPWKIYPRPPPPHWHWTDKDIVKRDRKRDGVEQEEEEFEFEECPIPESHPWRFEIDEKGVYQVYKDAEGVYIFFVCLKNVSGSWLIRDGDPPDQQPLFDVPNLGEYFKDMYSILGVISDGPTKSFAYKRLKYLAGKFDLYTLMNDSQETAAMKVRRLFSMSDFPCV